MNSKHSIAVTEVISLILVFGIMTTAISVVTLWGTPYMDEKKSEARAKSALAQLNSISNIIKDDVISQGINGSSVDVKFSYENGNIIFSPEGERLIIYYSLDSNFDFDVSGLEKSQDDPEEDDFTLNINENPGLVNRLHIYYLYRKYDEIINMGDSGNFPIADAVQIDLFNLGSGIVYGRIWLFDTGSITYNTAFSNGIFKVIAENGGVVFGKDSNGYLSNKPTIYNEINLLVMRIIQLKPGDISGGGAGKITYKFTVELKNHFIRENKVTIPEKFKMQIFGDEAAVNAWKNYFKIYYDFDEITSGFAEGTIFLNCNNKEFSLTHSICDFEIKVEG